MTRATFSPHFSSGVKAVQVEGRNFVARFEVEVLYTNRPPSIEDAGRTQAGGRQTDLRFDIQICPFDCVHVPYHRVAAAAEPGHIDRDRELEGEGGVKGESEVRSAFVASER